MSTGRENEERADVLIVTAVKEEWDAVLAVDTDAEPRSRWETRPTETGPEVAYRAFTTGSRVVRVAVIQAFGMGREQAVIAAAPVLDRHPEIQCLAMCGVCAGRRGDVALGDVIIADRTWPYDAGKLKVDVDEHGRRDERFQGDMDLYRIHPPEWKQRAERFQPDPTASWISARPQSYEQQGDWLLERLAKGDDPTAHTDRPIKCPDWGAVLEQLWKVKRLKDNELILTDIGSRHIRRRMTLEPGGLREPAPFKAVVGPIASGAPVVQDPTVFDRIATIAGMRKVLGLEMETSAILALAYLRKLPYAVVMKGVMDHADAVKSDNMKPFAARASAECLIAFLRQNLSPRTEDREKDSLDGILEPGTSPLPKFAGPAALLNARHEIVPFHGRAAVLENLRSWCEADAVAAARLMHGPGGMGKTRLFIELCQLMRAKGWRAGFVPKSLDLARFARLVASEMPTLAVIDYAESRPNLRELLALALKRRNGGGTGRIRVMLLSRTRGDWWEAVLRSDVADILRDEEPMALSPLVVRGDERDTLCREAMMRFAEQRGTAAAPGRPADLSDPQYDRVLYVHMAGLATVEGREVQSDTLLDDTLTHEEQFWTEQFRPATDMEARHFKRKIRRVVAALTLLGGASDEAEAEALVGRVRGAVDKVPVEMLTMFLHDIYPSGALEQGSYLTGLEPDLLGEAMVYRSLKEEGRRVGEALDLVFEGASDSALRTGFEVLGRLSGEHPDVEGWITRVLDPHIPLRAIPAFEAAMSIAVEDPIKERAAHTRLGMALGSALVRGGTIELAQRLEPELPSQTLTLREVGRWCTETMLKHLPDDAGPDNLPERVRLLNNLGNWLGALGKRDDALRSMELAVSHCRRLARLNSGATVILASQLNNLGRTQLEVGQIEAALASMKEGVAIRRKLAELYPETSKHDLALGLVGLGATQGTLGEYSDAVRSTQEAIDVCRSLSVDTEAALPDLALGLNNLASMQGRLGQLKPGLASAEESVEIYRKLTSERPGTFLPELARSLGTLANRQGALMMSSEALTTLQEAVGHYRKLAEARPDAFLPDLALNLGNLVGKYREIGRDEAALAAARESVQRYKELARERPTAFLGDLARGLLNLGVTLIGIGQFEDGLISTQEALDYYRELARTHPEAFLPDLSMCLNNLGAGQLALGRREDALSSTLEAVSVRRRLAEVRPTAFLPVLAESLINLGLIQRELEKSEAALISTTEALDVIWPFFTALPRVFRRAAGAALLGVQKNLDALGQRPSPEFLQRLTAFETEAAD